MVVVPNELPIIASMEKSVIFRVRDIVRLVRSFSLKLSIYMRVWCTRSNRLNLLLLTASTGDPGEASHPGDGAGMRPILGPLRHLGRRAYSHSSLSRAANVEHPLKQNCATDPPSRRP